MSITIEGYTVVAKKSSVIELLESGRIQPHNGKHIADDHLGVAAS